MNYKKLIVLLFVSIQTTACLFMEPGSCALENFSFVDDSEYRFMDSTTDGLILGTFTTESKPHEPVIHHHSYYASNARGIGVNLINRNVWRCADWGVNPHINNDAGNVALRGRIFLYELPPGDYYLTNRGLKQNLDHPYRFTVSKKKITYIGELKYRYNSLINEYKGLIPKNVNKLSINNSYTRDVKIFRSIFKGLANEPVEKGIMQKVSKAPEEDRDENDF